MPSATGKLNPELSAKIDANPDDPSLYSVYADWLQSEGDVLGELASVQTQLVESPDDPALLAKQTALFEAHRDTFFGPEVEGEEASEDLEFSEFRWGRPAGFPKQSWSFGFARTVWNRGFIQRLFFDTGYYDDEEERGSEEAVASLIEILKRPCARHIQALDVRDLWADYGAGPGPDTGFAVKAVVEAPCAAGLRRLTFHRPEHDVSGVECSDHGLAAACPRLEELQFFAGMLGLSTQDWPSLRVVRIRSGGLDGGDVRRFLAGRFPVLEELEIWFGNSDYGADVSVKHLERLFAGEGFETVRRVGLMNGEFGDDLCTALVSAPLLPQLTHVDMTMGVMRDGGLEALIAHADRLDHLEKLAVAGYFSEEVAHRFEALGSGFSAEIRGNPDEEWTYTEVGE